MHSASDIEAFVEEYKTQFPLYQQFANDVRATLEDRLVLDVEPTFSARAKAVESFRGKILRKDYSSPLDDMTDLAGCRVIVGFLSDVNIVADLCRQLFQVVEDQDKQGTYAPHELGYLGRHLIIRESQSARVCEIQIHTKAQHAWAETTHDLVYKPHVVEPSPSLLRRSIRLVALVEMFDEELERIRNEISATNAYPPASMLSQLTPLFKILGGRSFDSNLSVYTLNILRSAYSDSEYETFLELVGDAARSFEAILRQALSSADGDTLAPPFLTQPEVLVIFERLCNAPHRLRNTWDHHFDPSILDVVSESLGRPAP